VVGLLQTFKIDERLLRTPEMTFVLKRGSQVEQAEYLYMLLFDPSSL